MADNDSKLPTRGLAVDNTTEVANAAGTTINPAQEDGHLATIDSKLNTLGQKTSSGSVPVTIASDQTDVPVNVDKYGGTATTLGQKVSASSVPVVLASDQSPIPVNTTPPTEHVPDYKAATAVAAAASDTHNFSPSSTINLDKVYISASGRFHAVVEWGTTGSEVVYFTGFGEVRDVVEFELPNPVVITSTMSVKVIVTNDEPVQAQNLYSSIVYH